MRRRNGLSAGTLERQLGRAEVGEGAGLGQFLMGPGLVMVLLLLVFGPAGFLRVGRSLHTEILLLRELLVVV